MPECRRCGVDKDQESFSKSSRYLSGFFTLCKDCDSEQSRQRYNSLKQDEGFKRKRYETRLKSRYGISFADVCFMLAEQRGRCAVCEETLFSKNTGENTYRAVQHIDHCHKSGKVRGLLCPACNKGLGHFYDDPAKLRKAADYLEGTK